MPIFSQLQVDSQGRVKMSKMLAIGSTSTFDTYSLLKMNRSVSGSFGYNLYSSITTPATMTFSQYAAIYGFTQQENLTPAAITGEPIASTTVLTTQFAAGVAGVASSGVGVYGAVGTSLPTDWTGGNYAGYFNGTTRVYGALLASTVINTSDMRLKTDIRPLTASTDRGLYQLTPVTYKLKTNQPEDLTGTDSQVWNKEHYGLIAQEVKEVFPELVYEDASGYMAINYIELIPLMLKEMKDLNERITELEDEAQTTQKKVGISGIGIDAQTALYQNVPNPFDSETVIGFYISRDVKDAFLYIYDMNGVQIEKFSITNRGEASITIKGKSLQAGMYLYSLIADNKVIDTKRMILTK